MEVPAKAKQKLKLCINRESHLPGGKGGKKEWQNILLVSTWRGDLSLQAKLIVLAGRDRVFLSAPSAGRGSDALRAIHMFARGALDSPIW